MRAPFSITSAPFQSKFPLPAIKLRNVQYWNKLRKKRADVQSSLVEIRAHRQGPTILTFGGLSCHAPILFFPMSRSKYAATVCQIYRPSAVLMKSVRHHQEVVACTIGKTLIMLATVYYLLLVSSISGCVWSGNVSDSGTRMDSPALQQTDEWTKRLCSVLKHSAARTLPNKPCSVKDVGDDIMILLVIVMRRELADCPKIYEPKRTWQKNIWCTILVMSIFQFKNLEHKYLSQAARDNVHRLVKSSQSQNATVHHSRNIIEKCNLEQASSNLYCGISSGPSDCKLFFMCKMLLFFLTHPPTRGKTSIQVDQTNLGCWEPELEGARQLLAKPGKWDMDDKCVDTLKDIALNLFTVIILQVNGEISRLIFGSVSRDLVSHGDLFSYLQSKMVSLMFEPTVLQRYVYSTFEVFKAFVRHRNQLTISSKVLASCQGIRGTKSVILKTVLKLLPLPMMLHITTRKATFSRLPFPILSLITALSPSIIERLMGDWTTSL